MKKKIAAEILTVVVILLGCIFSRYVYQKERCWLCGSNSSSPMSVYRGRNSLGLLRLNTFDVMEADAVSVLGDELSGSNEMHITVRGEGYGMVIVQPDHANARTHISIDLGEKDKWDPHIAARRLCRSCFKKVRQIQKECGSSMNDLFLVDLKTAEIYYLEYGRRVRIGEYVIDLERTENRISGYIEKNTG